MKCVESEVKYDVKSELLAEMARYTNWINMCCSSKLFESKKAK